MDRGLDAASLGPSLAGRCLLGGGSQDGSGLEEEGPYGGGGERKATKSQSWTVFVILQRPLLPPDRVVHELGICRQLIRVWRIGEATRRPNTLLGWTGLA